MERSLLVVMTLLLVIMLTNSENITYRITNLCWTSDLSFTFGKLKINQDLLTLVGINIITVKIKITLLLSRLFIVISVEVLFSGYLVCIAWSKIHRHAVYNQIDMWFVTQGKQKSNVKLCISWCLNPAGYRLMTRVLMCAIF